MLRIKRAEGAHVEALTEPCKWNAFALLCERTLYANLRSWHPCRFLLAFWSLFIKKGIFHFVNKIILTVLKKYKKWI